LQSADITLAEVFFFVFPLLSLGFFTGGFWYESYCLLPVF